MGILTLVSGLLLSYSYSSLKERTKENIAFDIKRNIIKSAGYNIKNMTKDGILKEYNYIDEIILDLENNKSNVEWDSLITVEDKKNGLSHYINKSDKIAFNKNSSDPSIDKYLPLFYHTNKKVYILPISGKGLWSTLFGFISIADDGNTVKGITFYKHKETPGLGGEVDKLYFQERFIEKKIFNNNNLVSIEVVKVVKDSKQEHSVDGITGATITSRGLSNFLMRDLLRYEPFLRTLHVK